MSWYVRNCFIMSFQVYISNYELLRCPWPRVLNILEEAAFDATPHVAVSDLRKEFVTLPSSQQTFHVLHNIDMAAYLGNWRVRLREDDCPVCLEPINEKNVGNGEYIELSGCQANFYSTFQTFTSRTYKQYKS